MVGSHSAWMNMPFQRSFSQRFILTLVRPGRSIFILAVLCLLFDGLEGRAFDRHTRQGDPVGVLAERLGARDGGVAGVFGASGADGLTGEILGGCAGVPRLARPVSHVYLGWCNYFFSHVAH